MELPQLFGSDYVLPAIIAVVLLAAILGLLMLRRKRTAASAGAKSRMPAATAAGPAGPGPAAGAKLSSAERKAAKAAAKADAKATKASGGAGFLEGPGVGPATSEPMPDAPLAPEAAAGVATQAAAASAAPAPKIATQAQAAGRQGTSFATDPLQSVLTSVLQGWGDLTTEDTNRLDIFRREKVVAAINAVELPKDTKANEYARTRLTQLKRYAVALEKGEKPPIPEPELEEFVAIGATARAAAAAAAAAAGETPAAGVAPETAPETAAAPTTEPEATPTAEPAPESDSAPSPRRPSWYGSADETTAETGMDDIFGEAIAESTTAAEATATDAAAAGVAAEPLEITEEVLDAEPLEIAEDVVDAEPAVEVTPGGLDWDDEPPQVAEGVLEEEEAAGYAWDARIDEVEEELIEEEPAEFAWDSEPPAGVVEAPEAPAFAEAPAEASADAPEAPAFAEAPHAPSNTEDAIATAAAAFWAAPEASTLEQAAVDKATPPAEAAPAFESFPEIEEAALLEEMPQVEELPEVEEVYEEVVASAASGASARVESAADLLALPAVEQAGKLAFLEPEELNKVFQTTGDKSLKKSVIDTLEHSGSTASLDAIHACLEDPDPEIQLYALDAADRLLGTENQ